MKSFIKCALYFSLLVLLNKPAQGQILYNGSLTGPPDQDDIAPYGWHAIECDSYSTPDVYTSYFSNQIQSFIYPLDTPTFVVLRARGTNYNNGYYPPETREYLVQSLNTPMEANACYTLGVYLCTDLKMTVNDLFEPNISYPVTVEIWGSNSICAFEKRLYVSQTIQNTSWFKYTFNFCVPDSSYSVMRFTVQWDTLKRKLYNGILLVDSIELKKFCISDTIFHELDYLGDGKTVLTASTGGDSCKWTPAEYLSASDTQSVRMLTFCERIIAKVYQGTACPIVEVFDVKFDCAKLYPQRDTITYYYKYFDKVTLQASEGVSYDWSPKINLSYYDRRSPYMTGYNDHYSVTIRDKYNCEYVENFYIERLCDSLVPGNSVLILDTLLKNKSEIVLIPKVGRVSSLWNPSKWLSCIDCQTPVANPQNSITYSVYVTDDSFDCTFQENFRIELELFVPNIITPNNDGFNDYFEIIGLPDRTALKIFDKNGILLYSANPYNDSNWWKGTNNNGTCLESNTYWYVLENPKLGVIKKGFIFLKR